jgi:hypothetical protein
MSGETSRGVVVAGVTLSPFTFAALVYETAAGDTQLAGVVSGTTQAAASAGHLTVVGPAR